jgi:hypothetical protein
MADAGRLRQQWAPLGDAVRLISVQKREAYVVVQGVHADALIRSVPKGPRHSVESLGCFDSMPSMPITLPSTGIGPTMITPPKEKGGLD